MVQVYEEPDADGTPWAGVLRVGLKYSPPGKRDRDILSTWSDMERLKESLFPDRLAIEVYPTNRNAVLGCPMRWIWVLPKGHPPILPFNLLDGSKEQ